MNMLIPTLVLYALAGVGVAGAVYLSSGTLSIRRLNVLLAIPFWPLYLPLLLARPSSAGGPPPTAFPPDEMTAAIVQAERELAAALTALHPSEQPISTEDHEQFVLLRNGWHAQAGRIRAMDQLLASPEYRAGEESRAVSEDSPNLTERVRERLRARKENVERLRQVRHQAYDDLMARLAWVRERVSMIQLSRFSGAPAVRAHQILAQLATWGEGIGSAVPQNGSVETSVTTGQRVGTFPRPPQENGSAM